MIQPTERYHEGIYTVKIKACLKEYPDLCFIGDQATISVEGCSKLVTGPNFDAFQTIVGKTSKANLRMTSTNAACPSEFDQYDVSIDS